MDNGFMITGGEAINLYSLLALKSRLKLEILGMTCKGKTAYSYIKSEFGFKGNKKRVLEQFEQLIEDNYGDKNE